MPRSRPLAAAVAALALSAIPAFAQSAAPASRVPAVAAVELAGVSYAPSVAVGNARLALNGAGIRYKAVFKVYTAGLYLGGKAATPEAVYAAAGPKRLHISMLRDIEANEFGKMFTDGMQKNASREEFGKAIPGTLALAELFASRKKLATGDYFYVDYTPGLGTQVLINGKPAGDPIKEPEFFNTLIKIWLGKNPADWQLKDALLGQPKA